jgi:hypothetical protein
MPLQQILPTWLALNACNDTSASGMTDLRTSLPVNAGGLNLGDYFDVTMKEALSLSYTANGTLYAGRYRRVQVDSGATAANVKQGTIGLMPSPAAIGIDIGGKLPLSMNVVTSYDQGLATSLRPVVFLNTITPGNFGFVQELGVATVLAKASIANGSNAIGDIIISSTSGLVDDPSSQTTFSKLLLGIAVDLPVSSTLFRILMSFVPTVQD